MDLRVNRIQIRSILYPPKRCGMLLVQLVMYGILNVSSSPRLAIITHCYYFVEYKFDNDGNEK